MSQGRSDGVSDSCAGVWNEGQIRPARSWVSVGQDCLCSGGLSPVKSTSWSLAPADRGSATRGPSIGPLTHHKRRLSENAERLTLAQSGMAASGIGVVESGHCLGLDTAKRYRLMSIVQVRPNCAMYPLTPALSRTPDRLAHQNCIDKAPPGAQSMVWS